jgi:hypothetical protein
MGTRNRPADAYRFARGETLGVQPYRPDGQAMRTARLDRPLDFAAVTDHAELLGEWNICNHPELEGYGSLVCRIYRNWPRAAFFWMNYQANRGVRHDFCGDDGALCREAARGPWNEIQEAAEEANDESAACRFTAFNAYEWTGAAGTGNNFHRNVIFENAAVPELPVSFIEAMALPQFWSLLDQQCTDAGTGCEVLVIPHNTNLGDGMMFSTLRPDGAPITREDAMARRRYERLVEMMQHKGDSECRLGLETEDELCQFEMLPASNFGGMFSEFQRKPPVARQFVRKILKEGLQQEQRLGVNPFELGFIASTDTHLGTPGLVAESADYPGHGGAGKPAGDDLPTGLPDLLSYNPGGLAVVWAEENTRSALFDAMQRKETYGTSGPRMTVRFYGGWDYAPTLCAADDLAAKGYAGGVPMGGRLAAAPSPEALDRGPAFAISALADPGTPAQPGRPLQRVQIIKGWVDDAGSHERVYEVAGNPDNGARVDPRTCEPQGEGNAALCSVWRDPDFDPAAPAFYYARVVENPTCRWSQKLCVQAGVRCEDPGSVPEEWADCCAESHRKVIQERAWTSPIWYRPEAQ